MSNEAKFLGTLMPSNPDLLPIVEKVREKYKLSEVNLKGEPIEEIYLGDEFISLEGFRQDIENHVRENLSFFPPETLQTYQVAKTITNMTEISGLEEQPLPKEIKDGYKVMFKFMKELLKPVYEALEAQIISVSNMLYEYILTGDAGEIPEDWFSRVFEIQIMGNPAIMAMATSITDIEEIVAQMRRQYRKTFKDTHPRMTDKKVSASYYMQLRRLGKKWDFIFEEYIRLNNISLPRDKTSKRYFDVRKRNEGKLRRLIDRSEKVLDIIIK